MRSVSPGRSLAGFAISVVALSAATVSMTFARPDNAQEPAPGADHAAVDAIFAPWSSPDSPGCSLGIVRDGELIYEQGYGSANLDWQLPIDTETVFYVGSVSKQFTAAAIAMLALDGEISLDDDIREYFPEMPAYQRSITVRHLVHHTSGIRDIYTLMALAGIRLEDVFSDEAAIALIAAQRETNFPPGDEYLYSNSGYFLLAQLVERVTGKTLREYASETFFEPLGMKDTHFHDTPGHIVERRATSYQRDGDTEFRVSYLGNFDKVGAGGLYTTVKDLLLWDRNFYTGDVGGDAFLDLIHQEGRLAGGDEIVYAFGLNVDEYRGLRTVSHGGSMMGFKAAFLQFPEQRFAVLAACNLGDIEPMGLARQVADIHLRDRMSDPEAPVDAAAPDDGLAVWSPFPAEEMSRCAGVYYSDELDVTYVLEARDGALWLLLRHTPERRVEKNERRGEIRAGRGGWRLNFEYGDDGAAEGFTVDAGRVTDIRFVRR